LDLYVKAVFERVMMPSPEQHLVDKAGIVDSAAESHPVRYLCDSFVRLKTKSGADTVNTSDSDDNIVNLTRYKLILKYPVILNFV